MKNKIIAMVFVKGRDTNVTEKLSKIINVTTIIIVFK